LTGLRLAVLFALLTFVSLAIETAVPYWLPTRVLIPNLIVILAVDLGLRHHGAVPAVLAFAMGYATDALSGTVLGLNAFLITIVFILSYEVSVRLLVTNAIVGAMAVFVGVLIATLGALAITSGSAALTDASRMLPAFAIQAAVSAAFAPPIFAGLAALKRAIGLPAGSARE
jgi:rod shape-determining protein MreD